MSEALHAEQPTSANLATSTGQQTGYLYRVCPADAARLRQLVTEILSNEGWTFGGASVWDFDAKLNDKRKNLRPITPIDPNSSLDVSGDFGHAFSEKAEVRWKRLTSDSYDVLILTQGQPIASLTGSELPTVGPLTTRTPRWEAWMVLFTPEDVKRRRQQWRLGYIEYLGANGAVQFVRYTQREERPE